MDAPPATQPNEEPAPFYVYAPSDIRPRQTREAELCAKASRFDWVYTGGTVVGLLGSIYVNISILKQTEEPGVRLLGPKAIGLF